MKESVEMLRHMSQLKSKELQQFIEERTAKHERNHFVTKCIKDLVTKQVDILSEKLALSKKFLSNVFNLAVLHQSQDKWHSLDVSILAGAFLREFEGNAELASNAINAFLEDDDQTIINYYRDRNGKLRLTVTIGLDKQESNNLDKYQFPMPMVVKPAPVNSHCNGYLMSNSQPSSYRNDGMVYYDLEKANQTGFAFSHFFDLDIPHYFDVKIYEGKDQFLEAYKAFCLKEQRAELIYDTFERLGIKEFYFTHFTDGRGRIYCNGWQFSEQGRDLDKARIAFSKYEKVTKRGMDALRINIANALGLDKLSYQERIQFVLDHDDELERLMTEIETRLDYPEGHQIQYKADEPYIGCNLLLYYRKAQRGEPVNCIVYADAVNQGFQLQSIICSDREMMEMTCAIGDKRNDMYNWLMKLCNIDKKFRPLLKKAVIPMGYGATRAAREKVGDALYETIVKATSKSPTWKFIRSIPKLWNPDWESVSWTLPDGFKTLTYPKDKSAMLAKKMVILGEEFILPYRPKIVKVERSCCLGPNMIHSIDAFIAREMMSRCNYNPEKIQWIKDYLWGLVTDLGDECDMTRPATQELIKLLKLGKECNWYSFRILDLVNAYNIHLVPVEVLKEMMSELPEKSFTLTRIHDSFGCHPNYLGAVMIQYRYCLYHLGMSNLMQHIADEIGIDLVIPPKNKFLMDRIKTEMYALC